MIKYNKTKLAIISGLVLLIISAILLFLFYPTIISLVLEIFPWLAGIALILISFILLWGVLYIIIFFALAIYYVINEPMETKESDYSIDSSKHSGEKQSGNYETKKD